MYFASIDANRYEPNAIPGGADRAPARLRTYVTMGAVLGGLTTGLFLVYRTFNRPGAFGPGWLGQWASWLFGTARREL